MSTDRVFREEDAIWWDANVKGPQRYTFKEMNEDYKGLSPFSNDAPASSSSQVKHVVIVDPNASLRVDMSWVNVAAIAVVILGGVAVTAILATAAVVAVVFVGVLFGILALAFARTKP